MKLKDNLCPIHGAIQPSTNVGSRPHLGDELIHLVIQQMIEHLHVSDVILNRSGVLKQGFSEGLSAP